MTLRELIKQVGEDKLDYELAMIVSDSGQYYFAKVDEVDVGYADNIITLNGG